MHFAKGPHSDKGTSGALLNVLHGHNSIGSEADFFHDTGMPISIYFDFCCFGHVYWRHCTTSTCLLMVAISTAVFTFFFRDCNAPHPQISTIVRKTICFSRRAVSPSYWTYCTYSTCNTYYSSLMYGASAGTLLHKNKRLISHKLNSNDATQPSMLISSRSRDAFARRSL